MHELVEDQLAGDGAGRAAGHKVLHELEPSGEQRAHPEEADRSKAQRTPDPELALAARRRQGDALPAATAAAATATIAATACC